jgi:hypothetical protein
MAVETLVRKLQDRWTQLPEADSRLQRLALRPWPLLRPQVPEAVPVSGVARDIHVKIASARAEWEEAFQLVADNYQARGYDCPGGFDYRFTSYHALPDTLVLVAKAAGRVVATMSLVPDNTLLGLPMESIYKEEVQELRKSGKRLFETGSLADRGLTLNEFRQVFPALMRLGWQCQRRYGGMAMVIAVNPRHSAFYARQGFMPVGPRRAYCRVQGHPAEAFYLDPELMQRRVPGVYRMIFTERLPRKALAAPRMPAEMVRFFGARSSQTDARLVEEILRYVEQYGSPRRW